MKTLHPLGKMLLHGKALNASLCSPLLMVLALLFFTMALPACGAGGDDDTPSSSQNQSDNQSDDTQGGTSTDDSQSGTDGTEDTGDQAEEEPAATIEADQNSELAAALADLIDGVTLDDEGNANITQEAIDQTTSLDLSNMDLSSIDGIEVFENLTYLDVSDNELENINVETLVDLVYLDCSENELDDLSVSTLTELETLICSDNNISELDLTYQTNLDHLDCSDNTLIMLDLSNQHRLTYLDCSSALNQDETLGTTPTVDLSNNTLLEKIFCDENGFTELDLTANQKLSVLECQINKLTELEIAANTDLTEVKCYQNLLEYLDISDNSLIKTLLCGAQTDIIMTLKMNAEQQTMWESEWKYEAFNVDVNVVIVDEDGTEYNSNASVDDFGNGGDY